MRDAVGQLARIGRGDGLERRMDGFAAERGEELFRFAVPAPGNGKKPVVRRVLRRDARREAVRAR